MKPEEKNDKEILDERMSWIIEMGWVSPRVKGI